eukprot:CAMPEP_0170444714 /NCGR_PEP_ID=MMETSP0117_2-20130122/48676_1 /TAXON_ID=400756 /ORGANISM="Durinskia baltica, Strain CSIRO CS-38" /LENGTH=472 /DNA_ID=CAMNT_0010705543 /DNA_START=66 /DNA_END=1482 /DNA_ORIENTATION=-
MTPRSRMSASALRAAAAATALAAAALGAQPLVPMQVVVSDKHACALHTVGVVTCWGYGPSLGIGLTSGYVGDAPNEMGEHLAAVDFGPGRYAVELIGAQYDTTIARLSDGTIVAWGSNNCKLPLFGGNVNNVGANRVPLNFGAGRTAISIAIGGSFLCVVLDNHQVKCMGGSGMTPASVPENTVCTPGKTLDDIPPIDVGSHSLPIQVMALGNTVCVLFEDGSVKCFGKADGVWHGVRALRGWLGEVLREGRRGQQSAPHREHRGPLSQVGAASAFGDNLTRADLGVGKIERLVGGPGVACAVAEGGLVKCWGHGGWCMTGSDAVYTEMNFHDNDVQVSSSADHVCTLANGDVRCYGANNLLLSNWVRYDRQQDLPPRFGRQPGVGERAGELRRTEGPSDRDVVPEKLRHARGPHTLLLGPRVGRGRRPREHQHGAGSLPGRFRHHGPCSDVDGYEHIVHDECHQLYQHGYD